MPGADGLVQPTKTESMYCTIRMAGYRKDAVVAGEKAVDPLPAAKGRSFGVPLAVFYAASPPLHGGDALEQELFRVAPGPL
jgi:hypothetical protein